MDRPKSEIKVTDKRIFTAEGDIREEFRHDVNPVDPVMAKPSPPPAEKAAEIQPAASGAATGGSAPVGESSAGDRRNKSIADKALNPGTPFTNFIEPLIAQAYVSLGMLRNPHEAKPMIDATAARQMIEILTMLKERTNGNLSADEDDFLSTHLGELKLAFVQRTKSLS